MSGTATGGGGRQSKLMTHDSYQTLEGVMDACIRGIFHAMDTASTSGNIATFELIASIDIGDLMHELDEMEDTDDMF